MIPRDRSQVKSEEEWSVVQWLYEAVKYYLVRQWDYEPKPFTLYDSASYNTELALKTKVKTVAKSLHMEAAYTPDFEIHLTELGLQMLGFFFEKGLAGSESGIVYIDAKGSFNPYQNDQRYFSLVQKAVWFRHGIWPQKVVPFERKVKGSLFLLTFAPESLRRMKRGGGLNSCGRSCRGIEEFLKESAQ